MKRTFLRNLFVAGAAMIGTVVNAATVNVTAPITTNTTWTSDNTYILVGEITVKDGATLTIQPGTIIKGDKNSVSRLVVTRTGKIHAQGTAGNPIVFTSNEAVPARGDWAGISILGNAPLNVKDANGNPITKLLECGEGADYEYGGSNTDDSSGVLSYVRIQYAGFICGTNTELNSLSLCGVGRKTVINHIEVSYSLDDAIEIWGGSVNIDHFVTYSTRDDDFDTDNGWTGKAQFGLIIRDPMVVDEADLSNGFESDNNDTGTPLTPYTSGILSNITVVGPAETPTSAIGVQNGYGARLRRHTALSIFNSIFIGFNYGVRFEGTGTQEKATGDTLSFKNNIIGGSVISAGYAAFDTDYLANPANSNTVYGGNANDDVKLKNPFQYLSARDNYVPQTGSVALETGNFTYPKLNDSFFQTVSYRGAFGNNADWLAGWSSFGEPTGIKTAETYFGEVFVFPNPANNVVNVFVNSKENLQGTIQVLDISGRLLHTENAALNTGNNRFLLNTGSYANGLYFVQLTGEDFSVSRKISVVK